jgi:hypothetical protein
MKRYRELTREHAEVSGLVEASTAASCSASRPRPGARPAGGCRKFADMAEMAREEIANAESD